MFKKDYKNTGALSEQVLPEQFVAGEQSGIDFNVRIVDGNWETWLPKDEWQYKYPVETMSCVSFSANNAIEMQLNWMLKHNRIDDKSKSFLYGNGYIEDGLVNLSDRYLAIQSNTTKQGNYLTKVADTLRHKGAIPEAHLPFIGSTWEEYHDKSVITEEMETLGKQFAEHFDIRYEWVVTSFNQWNEDMRTKVLEHLRQAPLQIAKDGHATAYYLGVNKSKWGQYDTYDPFKKSKKWDYDPYYIMKILIEDKGMYTETEINKAKERVKQIVLKENQRTFFFRPDKNGEAYYVNPDGSFKYGTAKGTLFTYMTRQGGEILPISEGLWEEFKPAEIK
jgi:hypothetical protein